MESWSSAADKPSLAPDSAKASGVKKGAWILTIVLVGTATLAYIDRQMFNLFVEAIKGDLGLTDTQLGVLQGLAFSLFYGTMSIPLARLADSYSRKKLIAGAITFWSVMTAATGTSKSFISMFFYRAGTASGEAGLAPAAVSMLPDVFPREKLALPISIYTFSIYLGSGLAFIIGAVVQSTFGGVETVKVPLFGDMQVWRIAFLIAGSIGLPWLLILWKFMCDPVRMQYRADGKASVARGGAAPLREISAYLKTNAAFYLFFFVGFTLVLGALNGVWTWTPTILIRIFGMPVEEVGSLYGLIFFTSGISGAVFFGWLSTYLTTAGHRDGILKVSIIAVVGIMASQVLGGLAESPLVALVAAGASIVFIAPCISLPPAVLQTIVPANMRAQISAVFLMITGVFGLGLGPILVGLLTDYVFVDPLRLHYAVAGSVIVLCGLALPLLVSARKRYIQLLDQG